MLLRSVVSVSRCSEQEMIYFTATVFGSENTSAPSDITVIGSKGPGDVCDDWKS